MKRLQLLFVSLLATAPLASATSSFDPEALGRMKAVMELCSRASPEKAADYLLQMKAAIGDASKEMYDKAAQTDAYRQAYDSVRSDLGGRAPADRASACNSYLSSAN